ncbi:hypothetical protein [Sphingobium sp. RAC03]|uniref:hypothetical protein n=1 Tax=Sphingobium sp. RAC03 TaxID=1843368 RepID=UPI00083E392A|nr:hypothetical protein [Sphingobium sp. RAC03]AOF96309.1 hypothetical protein BSY17_3082 [Sphingobium sp. RAC03]
MTETTLPPPTNDGRSPGDPPLMPFWHMDNSAEGRSQIVQRLLDGFHQKSVSGDTDPIWMRPFAGTVKAIWFNILPVGWIGDWHPSPSLQWVVPLSGRWFIETQDGKRVEMGPGDIHWGADVETTLEASRTGHRSGQIGDSPCVQLMVQFSDGEV